MSSVLSRLVTAAFVSSLLAACAAGPRVTRVLNEPDAAGSPYGNVLVVALFNAADTRRTMEREIRLQLAATGIEAVTLTSVQKPGAPVNRDEVVRAAEMVNADAVLVTQLINLDTSVKTKNRSPKAGYKFGATYFIDVYTVDYKEYAEPPTVLLTENVSLQTDLYSAESRSRVWAITSESTIKLNIEDQWDDSAFADEAEAIVGALDRDRLIRR